MPRPPVKKTMRLAEAAEIGRLKAQLKMHTKKPLEESLKEHIGKMLDKASIVDIALYGSLAALSYEKLGKTPEAALIGPIALKLACSMGGTPPVAQMSGLAVLAFLGVATSYGIAGVEGMQKNVSNWYAATYNPFANAMKEGMKRDPLYGKFQA